MDAILISTIKNRVNYLLSVSNKLYNSLEKERILEDMDILLFKYKLPQKENDITKHYMSIKKQELITFCENLEDNIHNNISSIIITKFVINTNKSNSNNQGYDKYCECGELKLDSIIDTNEDIICQGCGLLSDSVTNPEVSIIKTRKNISRSKKPLRHYRDKKKQILGLLDKSDIKGMQTVVNKVQQYILKNRLQYGYISIFKIREILSKLKLSDYNKYTTLIITEITDIKPPKINSEIDLCHQTLFNKVINAYAHISELNDKDNLCYHPYIIYKLYEYLIDDVNLLLTIKFYIHLQEQATLSKNDKIWKNICKLTNIPFVSTTNEIIPLYKIKNLQFSE